MSFESCAPEKTDADTQTRSSQRVWRLMESEQNHVLLIEMTRSSFPTCQLFSLPRHTIAAQDQCFKSSWKVNLSYLRKSRLNFTPWLCTLLQDKVALQQPADAICILATILRGTHSLISCCKRGRRRPAASTTSQGNVWLGRQVAIQQPLLYTGWGGRGRWGWLGNLREGPAC